MARALLCIKAVPNPPKHSLTLMDSSPHPPVLRLKILAIFLSALVLAGCPDKPATTPPADDASALESDEGATGADLGPTTDPGPPPDVELPPVVACTAHADCDDDVACTVDLCTVDGTCSNVSDSAHCEDGDVCNGLEICHPEGGCQPGVTLDCNDDNACNGEESCDATMGCTGGTPVTCDNADACDGYETCDPADGQCLKGLTLQCDDGQPCNGIELCDPEVGCVSGPLPPSCCGGGSDCDDGLACNGVEGCDSETGKCTLGEPPVCDDGDACNGVEVCIDAEDGCVPGEPPVCEDGDVCTDNPCDPVDGCLDLANTAPCDDGSECTTDDVCENRDCVPGGKLDCSDGDACTLDACIPVGGCVWAPLPPSPPVIKVVGIADGSWYAGPVAAEFITDEITLGYVVTLDDAPYEPGTPIEDEGPHVLTISADGCSGAVSTSFVNFGIDLTPPTLTWTLDPPANSAGWNNVPTTITWHADDGLTSVATLTEASLVSTQGGAVVVQGEAVDAVGNVSQVTAKLALDFKAPIVSITTPKPNQAGNDQFVVTSKVLDVAGTIGGDTLSGFHSGLVASSKWGDQKAIAAPGSFAAQIPLLPGVNTLIVSARDVAGNTGTASVCVILDADPPKVFVQSPQDGWITTEETVTVTGLAHDLVVGTVTPDDVTVTVNGQPAAVSLGQFLFEDLALEPGVNAITAVATDAAGLTDQHVISVIRKESAGKRIVKVSGDLQTAPVSSALPQALVVKLMDDQGEPLVDELVAFAITNNNGTLKSDDAVVVSPRERGLHIKTDAQGLAQAQWTLGARAGAALNRVTVSSLGAASSVDFHASGSAGVPVNIHAHAGADQSGTIGQPLPMPLGVLVTDAGHNPVDQAPVTFAVLKGDGKLGGTKQVTVLTNAKGFADVVFAPGDISGRAAHVVRATIPVGPGSGSNTELGVTFTASAFAPRAAKFTAVNGQVVDENEQPLAGVELSFPEHPAIKTVRTREDGSFTVFGAPAGFARMVIDGRPAAPKGVSWTFPRMVFELHNVAGTVNTLDRPIFLLRLNEGTYVDGLFDVTLTLKEAPGFELTIPAGTQVTFPDGTHEGHISVTQVHFDQAPMAPTNGLQSNLLVTIQPAGVHFDPPAPLQLPNVDGFAPGEKVEMFSFDHDLETFVPIGLGSVNDDGTVVRSDPGVGVVKGGWHCGTNPNPTGECSECDSPGVNVTVVPVPGSPDPNGFPLTMPVTALGGAESYIIKASGAPGPGAHWEWCASGDIEVEGGSCPGQLECTAQVTPKVLGVGAIGKVKIQHVCDETGEVGFEIVPIVICDAAPEVQVTQGEFNAGLPLQEWANFASNRIEALGCTPACKVWCAVTERPCGHGCIPLGVPCGEPPGHACEGEKPVNPPPALSITTTSLVAQHDICCPGCPAVTAPVGIVSVDSTAAFGDECASDATIEAPMPGYELLKLKLSLSYALSVEADLEAPFNHCGVEETTCWQGAVNVTGVVNGQVVGADGLSAYGLQSVSGSFAGGALSDLTVECGQVCGKINWTGITTPLTLTTTSGASVVLPAQELVPAQPLVSGCFPLTLPEQVPAHEGGCANPPAEVPDPECAEVLP